MWFVLAAAVIGGIVGHFKEKEEGAWFGWGLAFGIIGVVINSILSLLIGLFVYTNADSIGEKTEEKTTTYTVSNQSGLSMDGKYLEFFYLDDQKKLKEFSGYMDEVQFEGNKRDTVEVTRVRYTVKGVLPWDIHSTGDRAVVR